ncbi:unnamed protein product [Pleuronectes platessa]|uniref:Uncharacterized protein n=1 Tax=Pleuronectes platessa TaxID=8262 RepID=A0A9N7U0W6_PLEPL|nr:unnamed protein product [Pleuronectes platessa]
MEQSGDKEGGQRLEGEHSDTQQAQSLGVLNPHMDQIDGLEPEDQDETMEVSNHLSQDFQPSFEGVESKSAFPESCILISGRSSSVPSPLRSRRRRWTG